MGGGVTGDSGGLEFCDDAGLQSLAALAGEEVFGDFFSGFRGDAWHVGSLPGLLFVRIMVL